MGNISVNWVGRNLATSLNIGAGNHHFILIVIDGICVPLSLRTQFHNGSEFLTLGAFSVGGNMVFEANNASDVAASKDILDKTPIRDFFNPFDWGAQKHKVNPPGGSSFQFSSTVVRLAQNYEKNTKQKPLEYTLFNDNCASWVNTLFKVAGVCEAERRIAGQFWGVDAAEQLEIPEELFK